MTIDTEIPEGMDRIFALPKEVLGFASDIGSMFVPFADADDRLAAKGLVQDMAAEANRSWAQGMLAELRQLSAMHPGVVPAELITQLRHAAETGDFKQLNLDHVQHIIEALAEADSDKAKELLEDRAWMTPEAKINAYFAQVKEELDKEEVQIRNAQHLGLMTEQEADKRVSALETLKHANPLEPGYEEKAAAAQQAAVQTQNELRQSGHTAEADEMAQEIAHTDHMQMEIEDAKRHQTHQAENDTQDDKMTTILAKLKKGEKLSAEENAVLDRAQAQTVVQPSSAPASVPSTPVNYEPTSVDDHSGPSSTIAIQQTVQKQKQAGI